MTWYDSDDGDWTHLIPDYEEIILGENNLAVFHYMTGKTHWTKILGDPVPNYGKDGFEWTFDFTPDEDGLKLLDELKIKDKLKNKGDERGDFIQFRQREKQANGKPNFPITVVDARNRPWNPEIKIGNGSTVEVKFKVVDYGKGKPTGVYPQAVRVLEHNPYVRQEFAPLPEDNEYVQNFAEEVGPNDFEPAGDEIGVVAGDPLAG